MLETIQKIPSHLLVGFLAAISLCFIGLGIVLDKFILLGVPIALVIGLLTLTHFKAFYLLLLALIPLSIEMEVGGGFATDMPTEPLMVYLMVATVAFYGANFTQIDKRFFKHPIILLLFLHVLWLAVAVLYSSIFFIALKFLLAKLWYIIVFVFLTAFFIKEEKDFKIAFWCLNITLTTTVVYTLIRHYGYDFSFAKANHVMQPFYRNHVSYAVILVVFMPFQLLARNWYKKGSLERLSIHICIGLALLGIFFAYTRSAYLSLVVMGLAWLMFRYKLTKMVMGFSTVIAIIGSIYLLHNNNYLEFAPDYQTTIWHHDLNDHLSATFEGKDISSMERLYRWVAAVNMFQEHPITGFGPNNFYAHYQSYSVSLFSTYVSDNPEKSGVHNYFLMTLVEQGIIGLIIFVSFILLLLIKGESIYHRLPDQQKGFCMAILVSLVIIIFNNLLSDLIETDKIGTLFFMNVGMLVNLGIAVKNETLRN